MIAVGMKYLHDASPAEADEWRALVNKAHDEYNAIERDRSRPLSHTVLGGIATGQVWGRARTMYIERGDRMALITCNRGFRFWKSGPSFERNLLDPADVRRVRVYAVETV